MFFMPNPSDQTASLAHHFESLGERLKECRNPQEQMVLLRRMRILTDSLDRMVLLARKAEITSPSAQPEP